MQPIKAITLICFFLGLGQLAVAQNESNESYIKMYHQMQFMQEELMRLQGKIDHLENDLKKLKKQQVDDYVGLDKRIQDIQLNQTVTSSAAIPVKKPLATPVKPSVKKASLQKPKIAPEVEAQKKQPKETPSAPKAIDKKAQYKAAYSLIKEKKFDQAKTAFLAFVNDYPADRLVANCYYWLGELYILDGNLKESEKMFNKIVSDFPNHNKKPEAMYKLGRLYFDRGEKTKAKKQMQSIIDAYQGQNINAVKLAKDFLNKHFSQ
jgi:tol-pal system protein YbgF